MIRLYRKIKQLWQALKLAYQYDAFADSEEGWTSEDSRKLSNFFNGETGKKMLTRMGNFAIRSAGIATGFKQDFLYHAGVAHGIALQAQFLGEHFEEQNFQQALAANQEQSKPSLIHPGVREFALR